MTARRAVCARSAWSPLVSFRLIQYTPPTITATAAPTSGNIPLAVAFAANVTNGAAPFTYAWTFGDGNTGTGQATTHTYITAGTFTWTVTVTDGMANDGHGHRHDHGHQPDHPAVGERREQGQRCRGFRLKIYGANFHQNCTS